jgi:hypothetical protein
MRHQVNPAFEGDIGADLAPGADAHPFREACAFGHQGGGMNVVMPRFQLATRSMIMAA